MLGLALLLSAFLFQTVDRTAAPPVVPAAGIAVEQLMRLPEIDGREWIEISPAQRTISATSAFGAFTLTVEPMPENGGDVVRHRVVLAAGPGSRVTLDPGNLIVNGFMPLEAIDTLGSDILHVHAHDGVRDPALGRGLEAMLGRDSADFPALLGALEERGYRGYLSIERRGAADPLGDIALATKYLQNLG